MNCQDISRIIDTGNFSALTDSERQAAESHARGCRHCAPLWFAHSHVAATRIPSMPPELAVRCLTLAAARAPTVAARQNSRRMLIVAGSLVGLAAAAAMVTANLIKPAVSVRSNVINAAPQAARPAPTEQHAAVAATEAMPAPAATTDAASTPPSPRPMPLSLPLLPAPPRADEERISRMNLALSKAVELYPELVQGPEREDYAVVALGLRTDGAVLSKSMQMAPQHDLRQIEAAFTKSLMDDMGSMTTTQMPKGMPLPDGRTLRANLTLQYSVVTGDFTPAQSKRRVLDIVRANRDYLLLPVSRDGVNFLTVLLSDGGAILLEKVELLRLDDMMKVVGASTDAAGYAKSIAAKLNISTDQLGLVGFTYLTEDPQPGSTEKPRTLAIQYAWPRRATQAEPAFVQGNNSRSAGIDMAAALVIVERMLPEVFTRKDFAQGRPTVVLTAEGEFIRAEYVKTEEMHLQMQKLATGRVTISNAGAHLVNSAGKTADVQFVWQYTAVQMEEMTKARFTPSQR